MNRLLRRAALAIVPVFALAAPAEAQTESFNYDYTCVMGSFQVCASVRLSSVNNQLTMQVWNLEGIMGVSHTMTSIGLYHSGSAFDWAGRINSWDVTYGGSSIRSYWSEQGGNDIRNLGGVQLELREGTSGNRGINGCTVLPGGLKWATCFNGANSFPGDPRVTFTFNLSRHFALSNVQLRWHSQQLPNGSSLKCDTGGAGDYPDCVHNPPPPPPTTVPEPATMTLLATGLVGIAAARRRRKKGEQNIA